MVKYGTATERETKLDVSYPGPGTPFGRYTIDNSIGIFAGKAFFGFQIFAEQRNFQPEIETTLIQNLIQD